MQDPAQRAPGRSGEVDAASISQAIRFQELEPDLACCREGGNGMPELAERHLSGHRDGRCMEVIDHAGARRT